MNAMPWEPYESTTSYQASSWRMLSSSFECKRTLQHIPDSTRQYWRKGDLIKFENGLMWWNQSEGWQEWFLSEQDYNKFLKSEEGRKIRNIVVPIYAAKQYAIIIGKYRVIKQKYYHKCFHFYDYGSIVLMLTGSRKGHVRRYFGRSPFYRISEFPHIKIPEKLEEFSDIIVTHKEDSEESRNSFVSKLYKKLRKEC